MEPSRGTCIVSSLNVYNARYNRHATSCCHRIYVDVVLVVEAVICLNLPFVRSKYGFVSYRQWARRSQIYLFVAQLNALCTTEKMIKMTVNVRAQTFIAHIRLYIFVYIDLYVYVVSSESYS